MKYIRKTLSIMLIITVLLSMSFSTAFAETNSIIYETSTTETITSGVTHEKITRFMDKGWLSINVLRVDLNNENVRVNTLTNTDSIQKLTNVKVLTESRGAVAAINASFFNWMKQSGYAYPDGPVVQSGKIISSDREYNRYNDSMGTFSISNLNEAMFNFWKTNMEIVAPNGLSATVFKFNKENIDNYNTMAIYDRKWSLNSPGATPDRPNLVEMVVNQNAVVEIRRGMPSVEIPENGYVLVANGTNADFLVNNFKVGDLATLNISTTPEWSTTNMAVTGSAILVKDGSIPSKFSYVSSDTNGKAPRTAVGSTKSGKELLLVTVDGRQNSSLGMTLTEMANLMISLGAYNALNLDGGGSTTMAVREPGSNAINIVNSPSDGSPRKVSTAIGIFSAFPTGALDGFVIDTIDTNVFVNTSRKFTLVGYDKYFNPVEIGEEDVKWSVKGIKGDFKGNTFYPQSEGEGTITATIGDLSSSIEVRVLGNPSKLILGTKTLNIVKGNTYTFKVQGTDRNGYTTSINPADVNWSVNGDIGKMSDSVFTATNKGVGTIDAYIGDTHAYCAVSVGEELSSVIDNFESSNGTFASSPSGTPGAYEISDEAKIQGNTSGKLTYDFTKLEGTRAAYIVFPDKGIDLNKNVTKIGVWVYNPKESTNWLRTEVYDSNGKKNILEFTNNMNWTGWRFVETSLANISLPAKLTRLYTVQVNPVPESGDIYLDDLTIKTSSFPAIDKSKIPQDKVAADESNKQVDFKESNTSFKFNVFSLNGEPTNLLGRILQTRLADKSGSDVKTVAILSSASNSLSKIVKKPIITADSGYKSVDISGSRLIQLNTSNKGLRTSATGQWQWFLDQLNSFKGKNVFILMKNSPESFSDSLEANLFKKVLKDYKEKTGNNIWLFYNDNTNESFMENGIRYSSLTELNLNSLNPVSAVNSKYIEVIVKDNIPTFQYKSVTQ
ncbi:phosphodiester glycosidase family protein [Acetivibrio cellulolyticus]|uniref:phosphodiester glycosidase family protein n=1 Tax=Acetivibrio cellulolyticus TaxID=35830 RepID=UPI0001E305B0|nr:phosphodiester glycosidase family protein [Acetivibrio cellulolyticus]